jgi:hypothetical protein
MNVVCSVYLRRKKRIIFWVLILSLLLVPLFADAHHHEDGKHHANCPICTFVYISVATTTQLVFFIVLLLIAFGIILFPSQSFVPQRYFTLCDPRGPPFLIISD